MTVETRVVSAFSAGRGDDATALVFEYMAATQAETGQAVPAGIGELPAARQRECRDLSSAYRPPGALLIAGHGTQAAGCAGLAPCSGEPTAEIKRLYVRPAWRGNGIARTLVSHAHHHAAQHDITRLILDVLPPARPSSASTAGSATPKPGPTPPDYPSPWPACSGPSQVTTSFPSTGPDNFSLLARLGDAASLREAGAAGRLRVRRHGPHRGVPGPFPGLRRHLDRAWAHYADADPFAGDVWPAALLDLRNNASWRWPAIQGVTDSGVVEVARLREIVKDWARTTRPYLQRLRETLRACQGMAKHPRSGGAGCMHTLAVHGRFGPGPLRPYPAGVPRPQPGAGPGCVRLAHQPPG